MPTLEPTETWTPSPCLRKVEAGDSLISIVTRCGHRNLDILPTVMQLNAIADEALIRVGQEIIVPPPSPTFDPAAAAASTDEGKTIPPPLMPARMGWRCWHLTRWRRRKRRRCCPG